MPFQPPARLSHGSRASTAFFPLAVLSPDQCSEGERAGCSVWQQFPFPLPLPPFPLGNSETKSILAQGYSLTSIPAVCYSQRSPVLVSASKIPPTSVQCKSGQVALQLKEPGGKREQPEQNNNPWTTILTQSISKFQAGEAQFITPTCYGQDGTGLRKEETSGVLIFPTLLKLKDINQRLHHMFSQNPKII